jgi:hypothetical protein
VEGAGGRGGGFSPSSGRARWSGLSLIIGGSGDGLPAVVACGGDLGPACVERAVMLGGGTHGASRQPQSKAG